MVPVLVRKTDNKLDAIMLVDIGNIQIGGPKFTVIAGPCSIESEAQFKTTAEAVKASGAGVLRGGIWKMRTSQKAFQGLGADAFEFIKKVKTEVGLPLISEITDIRQIEEVADVVDAYQIGARNMHNYSLLTELGKQSKPVLLKRSFSAFIDEWLKAADYITAGGNTNVILCERGIRTFETATRNTLDLNAVVYAKKHSGLPVIVDPSHAVGISDLVPQLCYAAAAAGADGIMVEVHPNPAEALSDGPQALTFETFDKTMKQLDKVLFAFDKGLNFL
jgi:3-deoxy-7-phosphoheptulonate synthase